MTVDERNELRAAIRRTLGWTLVAGLTIAAVTASFAVVSGDFDDTDGKVIGTSLGFAVYSAFAAAGASLRLRAGELKRTLGGLTVLLAVVAFLLLLGWLWIDDNDDGAIRAWGAVSLAAVAASHACIVTAARRSSDSEAVTILATVSILLGVVDATAGILPILEIVEDVDEGVAELIAVLVIGLLLTTALPPIMRRLGRPEGAIAPTDRVPATLAEGLARDVLAAADRIEAMNAGNAGRGPEIRRECERLRQLARQYTR